MPKKPVKLGLIVLLMVGTVAGVGRRSYRPERLLYSRATRILDYRHEKPDTQGYWLDEHTLLLVTGDPHQGYRTPNQWTGKVQRMDTRTGQRTPDEGLERMLNSLQAEPMDYESAPGGKWLLWTVAETPDHYPCNVVSTPDGKRHYVWAVDKFEEKVWVNANQWIHHHRHVFTDDPANASHTKTAKAEMTLPPVYVNDVRHPQKEQELAANSPQARALLASITPDSREYILEAKEGSDPPADWHLAVYDAFDYHIRNSAMPLRTLPLNFPFLPQSGSSVTSPDHQRIVYELTYEQASPLLTLLHRWFPQIEAPAQKMTGLWVSNVDGSDLREIGHILSTDQNVMQHIEWLADNRHISWHDEDGLYMVATE